LHGNSVINSLQVYLWDRLDIIMNRWLKVGRPLFLMFIASFLKIRHWFESYLWGQRCYYHGPILPYKLRKICWNTCIKHCHVWHHNTNFICRKQYVWEHSCEDYCLLGCDAVGQWWATFWAHGPNQEKKVFAYYIINSTFFLYIINDIVLSSIVPIPEL
jgi:hypothetical protein